MIENLIAWTWNPACSIPELSLAEDIKKTTNSDWRRDQQLISYQLTDSEVTGKRTAPTAALSLVAAPAGFSPPPSLWWAPPECCSVSAEVSLRSRWAPVSASPLSPASPIKNTRTLRLRSSAAVKGDNVVQWEPWARWWLLLLLPSALPPEPPAHLHTSEPAEHTDTLISYNIQYQRTVSKEYKWRKSIIFWS